MLEEAEEYSNYALCATFIPRLIEDAHLRNKASVEMSKNTFLHQISVQKNISSSLLVCQAWKQDPLALCHLEHKKGAYVQDYKIINNGDLKHLFD